MAKFGPMADYCRQQKLREFELPFHRIEAIIGNKLLASAERPQYWANVLEGTGPVRVAMKDTPYETFLVVGSRRVRFERKFCADPCDRCRTPFNISPLRVSAQTKMVVMWPNAILWRLSIGLNELRRCNAAYPSRSA